MTEIYEEKMAEWPVPRECRFIETSFGSVFVVVSGPENGEPLLLLHASGVASWSWKHNVGALSGSYRTYAIDTIGDAGKSEYYSLNEVMHNGQDQARHYEEIMDRLDIPRAHVVGASEGGFIASNLALHAPERVERLVLLGPMGYSGAVQAVLRMTTAQLFPLEPIRKSTFGWAFSDSETVKAEMEEWFMLLLTGVAPVKVAPLPLSDEERRKLVSPMLFVFGRRDNLVGNPRRAADGVREVPNATVEIVDAGHLMGAEIPGTINRLILEFLDR